MIPNHVSEELNTLSKAQQEKFHEMVGWSGSSGMGHALPVEYDRILEMVKRMGDAPIAPIDPPMPEDEQVLPKKTV